MYMEDGKRQDDKKVLIENVCQQSEGKALHSDSGSKVWIQKHFDVFNSVENCTPSFVPPSSPPFIWQPGPGTPQYSFLLLPRVVNLNIYYDIYLFKGKEMYFVRYLWKIKLYKVCEISMWEKCNILREILIFLICLNGTK